MPSTSTCSKSVEPFFVTVPPLRQHENEKTVRSVQDSSGCCNHDDTDSSSAPISSILPPYGFLITFPPFITKSTFSSTVTSFNGSPVTATTSANLPPSIDPT